MTRSDLQLFNSIGTTACSSVDFQHCVFWTPFDSVRNKLRCSVKCLKTFLSAQQDNGVNHSLTQTMKQCSFDMVVILVVILHLCKQVLHVDNTSEEFVGFVAALCLEKPSSAFEWLFWYFFYWHSWCQCDVSHLLTGHQQAKLKNYSLNYLYLIILWSS